MLKTLFRSWRTPAVVPAASPAPAQAADEATIPAWLAQWFADEPPETLALAWASLDALAAARPQPLNGAWTAAEQAGLPGLPALIERLDASPDPLPIPPQAPALAWRYLIFMRALCDVLEASYATAWQRGLVTRCPLTAAADPCPAPRGPARARFGPVPSTGAGLGALLAGLRLPEAGRQWLFEAQAHGVDWVDSAAFWALLAPVAPVAVVAPVAPISPAPAASFPDGETPAPSAPSTPEPRSMTIARASRRAAAKSAKIARTAQATPTDPASLTPLRAAVREALSALVNSACFNQPEGAGWWVENAIWVEARPFAEQVQAHPGVLQQPALQDRGALYQQMALQGLLLPWGARPLWLCNLDQPGQPYPRYVSVLKLPAVLYGRVPCPPYAGGFEVCADAD